MPFLFGGGDVRLKRYHLKPNAWWLLLISAIFTLSIALSNTFINIFVWKIDHNYVAIGLYNIAVYFVIPFAFLLARFISRRLHTVWALRLGIFAHAFFYALTLFAGESLAKTPIILGMIGGVAAGLFWFGFNLLCLEYTNMGSRVQFFGLNGVLCAMAGMIAPPVAGYLITMEDRVSGLNGYHLIFGLSFGLFSLATLISFKLHSLQMKNTQDLREAICSLSKLSWRLLMLGCAAYGLREGVFLFLIGLLMYLVSGSELQLGEFLLLQNALSLLSFFGVSRWVKVNNRLRVLGFGALGMAFSALLFLLPMTVSHILWYGSAIAIFLPLFLTPLQGFVFDTINHLENDSDMRPGYIITREIFSNFGRVMGILAFLVVVWKNVDMERIADFAVGLGFVQLGTWGLLRSAFPTKKPPRRGWKIREIYLKNRLMGFHKVD